MSTSTWPFTVRPARWPEDAAALRRVREIVFVTEQGIAGALEWDGRDAGATHVIARDPGENPIGTGRLLPSGQIGRMAVLPAWRGRGIGRAMLDLLVAVARAQSPSPPWLNAQADAVAFYRRAGFRETGARFLEAGIPHQRMTRQREPSHD